MREDERDGRGRATRPPRHFGERLAKGWLSGPARAVPRAVPRESALARALAMPTARIALKVISGEGRRRSRYRARASSRASSVRARLSAPEPRKGWKAKGPDRGKNCFTRFCTTLGRPPQSDPFFHALSLRTARSPHHGFDPRVHAPGGSRVRPRRAAHGDRALRRRRVPPLASAGARRSLKMRFGAPKTRRNASRARARVAPRARLEIAPRARIAFPARFRALSRRFARAIASARRC